MKTINLSKPVCCWFWSFAQCTWPRKLQRVLRSRSSGNVCCSRVSTGVRGLLKLWCAVIRLLTQCIHLDTCNRQCTCCELTFFKLNVFCTVQRFFFVTQVVLYSLNLLSTLQPIALTFSSRWNGGWAKDGAAQEPARVAGASAAGREGTRRSEILN